MRLGKPRLLDRVLDAIRLCGWDALIISGQHPFEIVVFSGDTRLTLLCYVWNITHGGYPRHENELRIQITGTGRLRVRDDIVTLLLGWSEELQAFAGFDATRHQVPSESPSVQIRIETMRRALRDGYAPQSRGNNEVAVAVRPDFFIAYVLEAKQLHHPMIADLEVAALARLARDDEEEALKDVQPTERREVLTTFTRKVRDAAFRSKVLAAYSHRCCMCEVQLNLLDAAHIIPVEHERGTDEVKNGLSLCTLHHRAFDHALVGIRADYTTIFNIRRFSDLRRISWDGGEASFKAAIRDQILLPRRRAIYPDPEYLVFGQELRGWSVAAIT